MRAHHISGQLKRVHMLLTAVQITLEQGEMKLAKHPVSIGLPHVTSHFRSVIELADIAGKVAPTSSC